jgi:beta-glucosidase
VKIAQGPTKVKVFIILAGLLGVISTIMYRDMLDAKSAIKTPTADAVYLDASQPREVRVNDLLSHMTREEKIGQLALIEKGSLIASHDVAIYGLGGLLSGSGSKPEENTVEGWNEMIGEYQAEARASRLGIPLLYGTDAIHGHAHVPGLTVFPHMIGLGATDNPALVERVARATAEAMLQTGANWNFAPDLDQPRDIRWGRTYESFSDDPALVSKLGAAYVKGLQGDNAKDANISVLATPKHYLGLGSMGWGTSRNQNFSIDQGVTVADEALLRNEYLPPFEAAVQSGALSVMVGLNTWGDKPSAFQKELLTDVLKEELKFKGFVVSDWYGVYEGRRSEFFAAVQAINAGVDMVMLPFDYKTFVRNVTWANRLGLISDERLDDATRRILRAKFALGLFDGAPTTDVAIKEQDSAHRTLAREVVAQSAVLLKNERAVLPLSKDIQHLRVAGSAADNVGRQMGAWSIEWQGVDGNWALGGTSILQGIQKAVGPKTQIEYNEQGIFPATKDKTIGIAVVGEKPYAEGWGDKAFPILDQADIEAIKNLQASCDKVIVVVVSGRPLLIAQEIDSLDALVMAWLPGSEGAGVADVLFGDKPFTGTLPLPWPHHSEQLPITSQGITADGTSVLFPRYFGIYTESLGTRSY